MMNYYINSRYLGVMLICFLLFGTLKAQSPQQYQNNFMFHYGLYQFNESKQDYIDYKDKSFLSAGLSYKRHLGSIAGIKLTGRYYEWDLDDVNALKTIALQSMLELHPRRISSSWRINRVTPYAGVGIGYERHSYYQTFNDSLSNNIFFPFEAGLLFNISSRLSLGVFAEYRIASSSGLNGFFRSPQLGMAVVNTAGITMSYNFGRTKTELSAPIIRTNPHFVKSAHSLSNEVIMSKGEESGDENEVFAESAETRMEEIRTMKLEKDPVTTESETNLSVIAPKTVQNLSDTIRLHIAFTTSVIQQGETIYEKESFLPFPSVKPGLKDGITIDSVFILVSQLNSSLAMLENINQMHMMFPGRTEMRPTAGLSDHQPPGSQISEIDHRVHEMLEQNRRKTNYLESELIGLTHEIEKLSNEIRLISVNKNTGADGFLNPIIAVRTPDQQAADPKEPVNNQITEPTTEIINKHEDNALKTQEDQSDIYWQYLIDLDKLVHQKFDSLSHIKHALLEELKIINNNRKLSENIVNISQSEALSENEADIFKKDYSITFKLNSSDIGAEHMPHLYTLAEILAKNTNRIILLSGFADKSGEAHYNILLSRQRVQSVKEELIKRGVRDEQIIVQYFGSEQASGKFNENDRKVVLRFL